MFRLFIRETRVQLLANGLARMFLRYNALLHAFLTLFVEERAFTQSPRKRFKRVSEV